MTKITLFILFTLPAWLSVQAQGYFFGIIQDKDGYVNVRNDQKAVIDKLTENHVFFDWNTNNDPKAEWHGITYGAETGITRENPHGTNTTTGNIHKSRICYLDDLPRLKCKLSDDNRTLFANDTVSVEIRTRKFRPEKHRIQRYEGGMPIRSIDGVEDIWGTECQMPQTEYASIAVKYPGGVLEFPREYLDHLYEPSNYLLVSIGKDNTLFIQSLNGDGAGGYLTVWTIQNYQIKNQLVLSGF